MNQSQRWPQRMIATENETISGAAANRLHPATIGFDTGRIRIAKVSTMNRTPKVCVEFEMGAAPLTAHRAKDYFQMLLGFRVCSVEDIPGSDRPTAEGHPICTQRLGVHILP